MNIVQTDHTDEQYLGKNQEGKKQRSIRIFQTVTVRTQRWRENEERAFNFLNNATLLLFSPYLLPVHLIYLFILL